MKQLLSAFLVVLILSSCTRSSTTSENKNVEDEVRKTLSNYYDDIAKRGLTAEFKYLDSSKDFFWVPPGFEGPISYDSVAKIIKRNAANYTSVKNVFDTLSITALSSDLATYSGRLRSSMTETSGKSTEFKMVETGILIKRKDDWKLLSGQTSMLNK